MPFPSFCDRALRQAQEDARFYRERVAELDQAVVGPAGLDGADLG